jgi:hypothetical protein
LCCEDIVSAGTGKIREDNIAAGFPIPKKPLVVEHREMLASVRGEGGLDVNAEVVD